jgi:hypothetical protein
MHQFGKNQQWLRQMMQLESATNFRVYHMHQFGKNQQWLRKMIQLESATNFRVYHMHHFGKNQQWLQQMTNLEPATNLGFIKLCQSPRTHKIQGLTHVPIWQEKIMVSANDASGTSHKFGVYDTMPIQQEPTKSRVHHNMLIQQEPSIHAGNETNRKPTYLQFASCAAQGVA